MGCGNSTDSVEKKSKERDQHHHHNHDATQSTGTAQTGRELASTEGTIDDRRSSVVPLAPRKSAAYDRGSSAGGKPPPLATFPVGSNSNPELPAANGSSGNPSGYDHASEHRASYNRLLAASGVDAASDSSPTYPNYRATSPSYGIEAGQRSSLASSVSGSGHMMPTNSLAMPFSPTAMGDRQRSSTASMLSASGSIAPRPLMAERNLSILSGVSDNSSTTKTTSDGSVIGGMQRSSMTNSQIASPGRTLPGLPGSLSDSHLTPLPLALSGPRSPGHTLGPNNSNALPQIATAICATKYPNTMYSYYPPVLGRAHHGLVTTNGKNAISTKTQTYTGKQYLKEYEHDMRRRAEWEEPFVQDMLDGRDVDRYKYRRRGQMPSLTLPVDEGMVLKEAQAVRHTHFSLAAAGPIKNLSKNNSRHQTTQDFFQLEYDEKMRSPKSPQSPGTFPMATSPSSSTARHRRMIEEQQRAAGIGGGDGSLNIEVLSAPQLSRSASSNPRYGASVTSQVMASSVADMESDRALAESTSTPKRAPATRPASKTFTNGSRPPLTGYGNQPTTTEVEVPRPDSSVTDASHQQKQQQQQQKVGPVEDSPKVQDDVVLHVTSISPGGKSVSSTQPPSQQGDRRTSQATVQSDSDGVDRQRSGSDAYVSSPNPLPPHTTSTAPPVVPPLPRAGSGLNILRGRESGSPRSGRGMSSGRGDRVPLPDLVTPTGSARDATNPMLASHPNNKRSVEDSAASIPLSGRSGRESSTSLHQQLTDAVQVASARGRAPAPPSSSHRQPSSDPTQDESMPGVVIE